MYIHRIIRLRVEDFVLGVPVEKRSINNDKDFESFLSLYSFCKGLCVSKVLTKL